MATGNIEFDAIKSESSNLLAAAEETEAAVKNLDGLMQQLCEKNDAPSLKRGNDTLTETVTGFIKAVRAEMESVNQMVRDAERLATASGYN